MKLATALLLLSFVAYIQSSCVATKYCSECTSSACTECPLATTFTKGAMVLSNGSCVARTAAQKVTVGASNVEAYTSKTATDFTVICKSGHYAWNDSVDTTKRGCYATSAASSAPLNLITSSNTTSNYANAPTALTNCAYIVGTYSSSVKGWACVQCNSGYKLATMTSCTQGAGITNCDVSKTNGNNTECVQCKTGYVVKADSLACQAETATTKNCGQLATGNTACGTCAKDSYWSGTACVKAAFLKAFSALLLGMMLYFN